MRRYNLEQLGASEISALCRRPEFEFAEQRATVCEILANVSRRGDEALRLYSERYDQVRLKNLEVEGGEWEAAAERVKPETREALSTSARNIRAFHHLQIPTALELETSPGVHCRREWRAIGRVGLYVPGGSAPLVSTVLMLGVPAQVAGCPEIILCTPPAKSGIIPPEILFAAQLVGITRVFKVGGAQAIAAMAYGTETIARVDKIFGPGNRFVALAKALVSQPPNPVAIDMAAGPSELLIMADETANPRWVAADLLTQAEHGPDSQVVLVATSPAFVAAVEKEMLAQLTDLPRGAIAGRALENSFSLLAPGLDRALEFANLYAPEHLILAVKDAQSLTGAIQNAGSVFIGPWSSVVFGDYASGTNHTLPTHGAARASGGIVTESFMKPVMFQTLTEKGFSSLSQTVKTLARQEGLEAHARAIDIREELRDRPGTGREARVPLQPFLEDWIRPHLREFQPYCSARSEAKDARVFLDANELSLGSPFALEGVDLNRYPDPNQEALRKILASRLGLSSDAIFVGAGSDEVIDLLIRLGCEPHRDAIVVLEPTYGVYRVAAESHAVSVIPVPLDDVFQIDLKTTRAAISAHTKIIFCGSPNNPTGNLLESGSILELCLNFRGLVVVDEAYVDFSPAESLIQKRATVENLVVLRTLSKAWGLAGIRLGYGVADSRIVSYLLRIKAPYNINAVTSWIARRSLENNSFLESTINIIMAERRRLAQNLRKLSVVDHVYPSDANFLLVRFRNAQQAFSALMQRGIVVRRRGESRLQNCLRISIGAPEENDLLLQVLAELS